VTIKTDAFAGKSRLQRHRMVNDILAEDLANSIHALELHLSD
jgi:BolA protein